ncbi:hypothetical protein [Schaalia odontolytica]|uniref:hypothetical protein n=1 Tax=Schaalia odontolytica TaxID=1660 RepID=UPI001D0759DE|nr:hypothetical protein [Schaalia odontolytica]MCB6402332.1 hypothetical protein [Schaalia odontolytica]
MTAKKLYHRLYARVVRARLRWSASPPVFFVHKRYWLSTMVAVAVVIGAVASVLAWRSHVERANRELDAQALAGATSVVNAYCDAILKGNVDEAAAMDGLANSTDPEWMLTDAGEDFAVAAGTFVSLSVSEGEMSPDRLTATFEVTSTDNYGRGTPEHIEMVAHRESLDAPWMIATSMAQTVTVELPAATTDVLFNGATIASFDPVAEWPVKGRALTLTLYPGEYEIGARSFSSEARLSSLPGKLQQLYRDDEYGAVRSRFDVELSSTGATTVRPFTFDGTVLRAETEIELVELITQCIDTQGSSSHLCPDATTNAPPRVKQADLRHEVGYYDIRVTIDSPTTFTIERLRVPNPAPGTAESYTGSGTMSYDENGNETITGITLVPSEA